MDCVPMAMEDYGPGLKSQFPAKFDSAETENSSAKNERPRRRVVL